MVEKSQGSHDLTEPMSKIEQKELLDSFSEEQVVENRIDLSSATNRMTTGKLISQASGEVKRSDIDVDALRELVYEYEKDNYDATQARIMLSPKTLNDLRKSISSFRLHDSEKALQVGGVPIVQMSTVPDNVAIIAGDNSIGGMSYGQDTPFIRNERAIKILTIGWNDE